MKSFKIGQLKRAKGFISNLQSICGHSTSKMEKVLGYKPGSLSKGYAVGLLQENVKVGDFEFRGYTNAEGGKSAGSDVTAHDSWKSRFTGNVIDQETMKKTLSNAAKRLNKKGVMQTAKVFPIGTVTGYKPGAGVVQYELTKEKKFKIAVVVGKGQSFVRNSSGVLSVRDDK